MKRGALIYLLIVFLLLNLTGCGANSVSAPSQKENDQEGESHYEENSQQEAGNSRKTSGTFTQPARLTLEEKELTVEEGQLFYGAFMVGLPEGVTRTLGILLPERCFVRIEIIVSTSVKLTLVPFMVASRSMVALASKPTKAATSMPPFNINLSLYSDREIRSKKRSII